MYWNPFVARNKRQGLRSGMGGAEQKTVLQTKSTSEFMDQYITAVVLWCSVIISKLAGFFLRKMLGTR